MLPNNNLLDTDLQIETMPSKNYKMIIDENYISGYSDDLESMKQVIYKILNTERYQYEIYSWNYGIELKDLIGEPVNYVCAELERRISEALLQDDRIIGVNNFDFNYENRGVVYALFTVETIFGNVNAEKAVNY